MTERIAVADLASAAPDTPGSEAAHAEALRRMTAEATPFRPDASSVDLVAEFAGGENRFPTFLTLYSRGDAALPAVHEGLSNANWNVRRWCAILIDNFADSESLHALVPLLNDPKADVRVWAVHSLSCGICKDGPNPIDAIPLLLDRIELDDSIRVRRQAVAMLAHHRAPDARVLPTFQKILKEEDDQKLRLHAKHGISRYAKAGLRE